MSLGKETGMLTLVEFNHAYCLLDAMKGQLPYDGKGINQIGWEWLDRAQGRLRQQLNSYICSEGDES